MGFSKSRSESRIRHRFWRRTWLFGKTVHEGCDRGSYYEQGDFAHEYGSPKCLVKIGCWGPVVNCNVTKRGWMDGIGGFALNPFQGEFYREALVMSRLTREMFCLMEGRHVHPSTLYPGGVGTVPSIQVFTDFLVRLTKYVEFMKKVVPLHDDLFDFFYQALPGYEEVGKRRILLGCWGSFQDPDECDYRYENMERWGRAMFVTPGIVVDGKLVTTSLVDINLGMRILLGSSYYQDWEESETFVRQDPLGNPIDKRHPWNQTTIPKPQKRDFDGNYTWVMSPRWFDKRTGDHLALDTGGGPIARLWTTALAGLVDIGYVKAPGDGTVRIRLTGLASLAR